MEPFSRGGCEERGGDETLISTLMFSKYFMTRLRLVTYYTR